MTQHAPVPASGAWKLLAVFAAGVLLGAVSAVSIVPAGSSTGTALDGTNPVLTTQGPGSRTSKGRTTNGTDAVGAQAGTQGTAGTTGKPGAVPAARAGLECAPGRNGGATDRGVTATEIKLATTVVESGPGAAFLGEIRHGMNAVVTEVNRTGGICGRRLNVEYKDDGWSGAAGSQYLRNYIQQGVFAIPVGASSEGLAVVINSHDLEKPDVAHGGPPVVGTDGLAIDQYVRSDGAAQPWVWPIATATASSARIMVDDAIKRGATKLAVVFDNDYRFGREAAAAFNAQVRLRTHAEVDGFNKDNACVRLFCGIQAAQNSYSSQVAEVFGQSPDFVALFLEPQTATTWMGDANTPAANDTRVVKYGFGGAQPLFTKQFEAQCKNKCDQMVVWTGFKPNIESYADDPAVRAYVAALRGVKPDADPYNQFTQGAYIGMRLLVDALRKVGPDLTRARLRAVLDGMSLSTGLTVQKTLRFRPDLRYANVTMQAFTMQYKGSAGGWRSGVIATDVTLRSGA